MPYRRAAPSSIPIRSTARQQTRLSLKDAQEDEKCYSHLTRCSSAEEGAAGSTRLVVAGSPGQDTRSVAEGSSPAAAAADRNPSAAAGSSRRPVAEGRRTARRLAGRDSRRTPPGAAVDRRCRTEVRRAFQPLFCW